jgi:hypothetical protein
MRAVAYTRVSTQKPRIRKGRKSAAYTAPARAELTRRADERANDVCEYVADDGRTLQAIADELNQKGLQPPRGGIWYPMTVLRLRERCARLKAA